MESRIWKEIEYAQDFLERAEQAYGDDFDETRKWFRQFLVSCKIALNTIQDQFSGKSDFDEWFNNRKDELLEDDKKFVDMRNAIEHDSSRVLGVVLYGNEDLENPDKILTLVDPNNLEKEDLLPPSDAFQMSRNHLSQIEKLAEESIEKFG